MQESLEERFDHIILNNSKHNKTISPLFTLPAELRNRIYEEILVKPPWKDIDNTTPALRYSHFKKAKSLLEVCRQVRFETSALAADLQVMSFADAWQFRRCISYWTPLQRWAVSRIIMRCHLEIDIAPEHLASEHYIFTFNPTWPTFGAIPKLPNLKTAVLEFTVNFSGCLVGYDGLDRDIRAVAKRIAMRAKCLGEGVQIKRKFIMNEVD
ncbi:hypothetical protein BDU57DRAFT_523046 [Ampelomyces quisqualis]|uniref:F-box domain-containing protein n=1 Tax=Ampelomyces quisqualis TaxID=50730 RepID=A0A6A5QAI9_AMPQU|nr:hypothetical protein BDU57DRAFT_523046 [Ampelomyces quisqualis]